MPRARPAAVIFEHMSGSRRRQLISDIEALGGVELRAFDFQDFEVARVHATTITDKLTMCVSLVLAAPYLVAMRVRGRTTRWFEVTDIRTPTSR